LSVLKTTKQLVFITSRFPYPLEKGDKLRAFFQLKELAQKFDVHLICLTESAVSSESEAMVKPYVVSLHLFPISKWKKWVGAGLEVFGRRPIQVGYFHHRSIQKSIDAILENLRPDHIYCQLIRATEYIKNYHDCPKTIDYMDTLSKGIERRIDNASIIIKQIFRLEYKRLLRYENHIFDFFEFHTIISKQDRSHLPHHRRDTITIVPNGVNELFFTPISLESNYTIVFTGNMSYPPNVEAAKYIVCKILPMLAPSTTVLISGASPTKEVKDLASEQVTITGWVDDIRESYSAGKLFIAPMFIGTGLQNKLLEAMACGKPCITTSLANNALGAKPNNEIIIANNANEFQQAIRLLLADKQQQDLLSKNAQSFVRERYTWGKCTQPLLMLIEQGEQQN
jgi:polysaccharide biosynthesis protein PslH